MARVTTSLVLGFARVCTGVGGKQPSPRPHSIHALLAWPAPTHLPNVEAVISREREGLPGAVDVWELCLADALEPASGQTLHAQRVNVLQPHHCPGCSLQILHDRQAL